MIPALMRRQMFTLGAANATDSAVQLCTPIILVRVLDEAGFGDYRLIWLAAATLIAILPLGMPSSLSYFLPRHDLRHQAVFVRQALLYMAVAGLAAGLVMGPWNPLLPQSMRTITGAELWAPLFLALWVFGSTVDILPNAERRITLQAAVILGMALLRGGGVIAAAVYGGIYAVMAVLAAIAAVKAVVLLAIAGTRYRSDLWSGPPQRWKEHTHYAVPVGAGTAVYLLRMQADQWLVVVLFGSALYGVYSIGAVALALGSIIRMTVTNVIFPEMNRAHADGDLGKVLQLNNRSNVACALAIFPVCGLMFAAAEPLVRLVYTDTYAGAIPVLRLNIIAYLLAVVEMSTVMLVLRQGPFLLWTSILFVLVGLLGSYAGAQIWHLPGAVAGAIIGNFLAITVVYARASRLVGIPIRSLQEWSRIARISGAAILAAVAAWGALEFLPSDAGHFRAIVLATACYGPAYVLGLWAFGLWGMVSELFGLPEGWPRRPRKCSRRIVT